MAIWMHDKTGEQFDDELTAKPGEAGFTRDVALAHFKDKNFSYMGTPNWAPPVQPEPQPADDTATGSNA